MPILYIVYLVELIVKKDEAFLQMTPVPPYPSLH